MKRFLGIIIACAVIFSGAATGYAQQDTDGGHDLRLLFIGNSLTHYNNMPTVLLGGLIGEGGYNAEIECITEGGSILTQCISEQTATGGKVIAAITGGNFDYIVIQASRRVIEHEQTVYDAEANAVKRIKEYADAAGSKVVIYSPFGADSDTQTVYRMGDDMLSTVPTDSIVMSRAEQSAWLRKLSDRYAVMLSGASVVGAGEAFEHAITYKPALDLYGADKIHPSLFGSYLTACCFYAHFFGSPAGLGYTGGISAADAYYLQKCAAYVILNEGGLDYFYEQIDKEKEDISIIAPSLNSVLLTNNKTAKITWSKMNDARGYKVYRREGSANWYLLKNIGDNQIVTYTDNTLKAGVRYRYKVCGYNSIETSKFSQTRQTYTLDRTRSVIKITAKKAGLRLYINKKTGASGYEIYRSNAKNGNYSLVHTVTDNSTRRYTDAVKKAGRKYFYRVRAYKIINGKYVYGYYSYKRSGKSA